MMESEATKLGMVSTLQPMSSVVQGCSGAFADENYIIVNQLS
jgi:hypothetical protein